MLEKLRVEEYLSKRKYSSELLIEIVENHLDGNRSHFNEIKNKLGFKPEQINRAFKYLKSENPENPQLIKQEKDRSYIPTEIGMEFYFYIGLKNIYRSN